MKTVHKPDYVKAVSSIFLEKYEKRNSKPATGVLFNKYLTLLNRRLFSTFRRDVMMLPHCWYRWGDEVVRYYLPYIDWNHDDLTVTTVTFNDRRLSHNELSDVLTDEAATFADEFIAEYSGDEGFERAIDEVYSEAPYPFQNEYRKLRESLRISRSRPQISNYYDYVRDSLFEPAMKTFPSTFKNLTAQKNEFTAVFELALESKVSPDELYELDETFWFFFCYHLRLDRRCHFNVRKETLAFWEEVLPIETGRFEKSMQNYAWKYSNGRINPPSDPTICQLTEDRKKRVSEVNTLLAELNDDSFNYGGN